MLHLDDVGPLTYHTVVTDPSGGAWVVATHADQGKTYVFHVEDGGEAQTCSTHDTYELALRSLAHRILGSVQA